jgi:hypothetical protein
MNAPLTGATATARNAGRGRTYIRCRALCLAEGVTLGRPTHRSKGQTLSMCIIPTDAVVAAEMIGRTDTESTGSHRNAPSNVSGLFAALGCCQP